jgi:hypothetical protein
MYGSNDQSVAASYSDRAGPYRVLKSHSVGPVNQRHLEYATSTDANIYAYAQRMPQSASAQEPQAAFLNMDLQFIKTTGSFSQSVSPGVTVETRKLLDIVSTTDRDKVYRLQRELEDERRGREPNYLPPIFGQMDTDRVIVSVPFGADTLSQIPTPRRELFSFQTPDGQHRSFEVQVGLAKKDSTYFVAFILVAPPPVHQDVRHPSSSPYMRDSPQYGYQAAPHSYVQPPGVPGYVPYPPTYPATGSMAAPRPSMPPYGQPPAMNQMQQTPRSEIAPRPSNSFSLPPIRSRPLENAPSGMPGDGEWQGQEKRTARVDIGGLLESSTDASKR